MRILMFTNTFTPHVGGVARSVQQFARQFRLTGHQVVVVAPEFPDAFPHEAGVIRIPAVQRFNGSDFSVPVPIPGYLNRSVQDFQPDVVHTHHPFLLGDTALRVSATLDIPIVFTHHTQYERYTHYVPGDSDTMKKFAIALSVGFCNLCDAVVAPSETIRERLIRQGVTRPIEEIPTGVEVGLFAAGDGDAFRQQLEIPATDFVVGHVGRLAPEKGIDFLAAAVASFIGSKPNARFLVAGTGTSEATIERAFDSAGVTDRLVMLGSLERKQLADVYAAMDVFAFASQSETQGMVLTEAMAASTPVVAVDASGVREVLRDGINGRLLPTESMENFVAALDEIYALSDHARQKLMQGAVETATDFSMDRTADRMMSLYEKVIEQGRQGGAHGRDLWSTAQRRIDEECKIWNNVAGAAVHAVIGS